MKTDVDFSMEIPCFKCLSQNQRNDCNPNECKELTEWLLKEVEKYQQTVERLKQTIEVFERVSAT